MRTTRARRLVPCATLALAFVAPDAWAYLDPSTGSMILSAIVGLFATAALAVKTYWYKLKKLFRRSGNDSSRDSGKAPGQEAGRDAKPASD
ncbi:MAG: hypothetical protein IT486_11875 [Gammaproteobacteria bacterium]|nr:hypothetical protein [Gammaproteobacteria bacterium]